MVCTFVSFSNKQSVLATNYDVVIETTIDQSDYKVVEIDNTTGTVNFYEFTADGDPILDGNNDQTTFVPGDTDFEDRMGYLNNVVIASSLTITSTSEFALPIFVGDGYYGDTITQICYDGDSSTDYRVIQHNSFDAPFTATSVVGTFAYMDVGDTSYTGFRYDPNDTLRQWDQNGVSGDNSGSTSADTYSDNVNRPAKFTIIGTTSSGKKVKIEDTGDGSGTHVYKGEDKNGNGKIDDNEWDDKDGDGEVDNEWDDKNGNGEVDEGEWDDKDGDGEVDNEWDDKDGDGEVDNEWEEVKNNPPLHELDDLIDEIVGDMESGNGSYEVKKAEDSGKEEIGENPGEDPKPVDIIIWFKKSNGSYAGIKIDYTGDGQNHSWSLEAKNNVSEDCRIYLGYTPESGDHNPTGSWSIGSKESNSKRYGWQNFARFNNAGIVDPNGKQMQYCFEHGTEPIPITSKEQRFTGYKDDSNGSWPNGPCPPM